MSEKKVVIMPCSGIGKSLGTVSRSVAYKVVDELKPQNCELTCLALLVCGDKKAVDLVQNNYCIALDGCPKECARKNIEIAGGKVQNQLNMMELYKMHKELKPESVLELGEKGERLVEIIAGKVALEVDKVLKEGKNNE